MKQFTAKIVIQTKVTVPVEAKDIAEALKKVNNLPLTETVVGANDDIKISNAKIIDITGLNS